MFFVLVLDVVQNIVCVLRDWQLVLVMWDLLRKVNGIIIYYMIIVEGNFIKVFFRDFMYIFIKFFVNILYIFEVRALILVGEGNES